MLKQVRKCQKHVFWMFEFGERGQGVGELPVWELFFIWSNIFVKPSKQIGYFFWKKVDISFIDKFGPDGLSQLIKYFSLKAVKFQSGYIYQYAFVMLIGFSILLTLLLVN